MSNKKYVPRVVAVVVMALFIVGGCIGLAISTGSLSDMGSAQPEYMTKLFDKDKVLEINIDIDESKFENLKENATDEEYYDANITINGETFNNIGIRAKGNSSLTQVASDDETDRYSFKIKADEYVDNQTIYGLSKFVLNNNIGDATYMKEYLSYDLLNKMGISTPGFAYANIKINGEDWGLYLAVESLEEVFVERTYGDTDGNLYKVETNNMGGKGGDADKKGDMQEPPMMQNQEAAFNGEQQNQAQAPPSGEAGQGMQSPPNGQPGGTGQQMQAPPSGQAGGAGQQGMQTPPDGQAAGTGQQQTQQSDTVSDNESFKGNGKMGGGPGGMGNSGGNLAYIDDDISSYTDIFDYTILKTTNKTDKKRLVSILKNLNDGTNLDECIDVDEVLKYFAVNTFLVNLDSYAGSMKHNYYLYENDGVLQILPWDYNLAFGAFSMGGGGTGDSASQVINFPIDTPVSDSMENSPLISKLLEVEEYKQKYHEYLQEIVDNYVNSGYFEEEVDKINNLISGYVENDKTAFFTYDQYKESIPNLNLYGTDRAKSIQAQLDGTQPSDSYGNIETTMDLKALGQQGGGKGKDGEDGMPGMPDEMNNNQGRQQTGAGNKQQMMMPNQQGNAGGERNGKKMQRENVAKGNQVEGPPEMIQNESNDITITGKSFSGNAIIVVCGFAVMIIATIFMSKFKRKRI